MIGQSIKKHSRHTTTIPISMGIKVVRSIFFPGLFRMLHIFIQVSGSRLPADLPIPTRTVTRKLEVVSPNTAWSTSLAKMAISHG